MVDDFVNGIDSETSTHVVDFLLQTLYKNLNPEIQNQIKDLVIRKSSKGKDDLHWMQHEVGMIVMEK